MNVLEAVCITAEPEMVVSSAYAKTVLPILNLVTLLHKAFQITLSHAGAVRQNKNPHFIQE